MNKIPRHKLSDDEKTEMLIADYIFKREQAQLFNAFRKEYIAEPLMAAKSLFLTGWLARDEELIETVKAYVKSNETK